MINSYKIKNINGEEVLYLYFDFKYEFSSEDFNNMKEKIEDNIKEFIKKNKISFKGATILLLSGGILFGSINLNTPTYTSISMENPLSYEEITTKKNDIPKLIVEEIKEEPQEEIKIEMPKEVIEQVQEQIIEPVEEIREETVNEVREQNIEKEEVIEQPKEQVIQEEVQEQEEVVDNNIYISLRRNGIVQNIELEEYVVGVVGAEMPASFNIEALKSQAIIARTYALKVQARGNILSDNESSQSYKTSDELRSVWGSSYDTYYNKIKSAVEETKGMYLTYNGNYIDAVYHSTSNGKTENSSNVWGNYYPYLVSVESTYDNTNPSYTKTIDMSYEELSSKLGIEIDENTTISIIDKTIGDRIANINIGNNSYTGVELRNKLGLRSADFDIEKNSNGVSITTRGYGHGVGLSQYGANGMAKNGYSYKDILKHYYKGVSLETL